MRYLLLLIIFLFFSYCCNSQHNSSIIWNRKTIIEPLFYEKNNAAEYNYNNISFQLFVREHDYISNEIRYKHFWEDCTSIYETWNNYSLWNYSYFIDVGANIGSCSILMLHKNKKVISFEPVRNNLHLISKSMLYDRKYIQNFTLYMIGLGEITQNKKIYLNYKNWGASSLFRKTKYPEIINIYKLDEVTVNINKGVGMMKIDIECSEMNMIQGAIKFIRDHYIKVIYFEQLCICYKKTHTDNMKYIQYLSLLAIGL